MSQRDGALFALDSLGQYELTLLLAQALLAGGELSAVTAATLLDHALLRGSTDVQEDAISVLNDHASRMLTPFGVAMPGCLLTWTPTLPEYVREWTPFAFAEAMMARPVGVWSSKHHFNVNTVIAALCLAWTEEKVPRIKNGVGVILDALFQAFPETEEILYHPKMAIDTLKIRKEVTGLQSESACATELAQRLSRWMKAKAAAQ